MPLDGRMGSAVRDTQLMAAPMDWLVARLPARLHPLARIVPQLSVYTLVSVAALAVDLTVFVSLTGAGVRATLAGVVGYCIGMVLHFALSTRCVFGHVHDKSQARLFTEFALSGAVGLLLTSLVIGIAHDFFGLRPVIAKGLAVGISFLAVFLLRKTVVFSGNRSAA